MRFLPASAIGGLEKFFAENPRAALAFSGGVDSAYLMYAASRCGADFRAYYVKSEFQPQFELDDARRLADRLSAPMTVIPLSVLSCAEIAANPPERCYLCKKRIFGAIAREAERDGFSLIVDGTNASDDEGDRPGMKALREMRVRSPLRECGLTKAEIRRLSAEAGLFTWDKPAYACLATRVPTGTQIDAATLRRVEGAEAALAALGFTDLRVRLFHGAARVQLPESQIMGAAARHFEIKSALAPYFDMVLLDMEGR